MATIVSSAVGLVVLFIIWWAVDSTGCSGKARKMGLQYDWGPVIGCMVKTKSGWRPIESLRDLDP